MRVQFLGSGDAFGSGGRLNTCILVESGGERLLLDFGATAMISLRRFEIDPGTVSAIVISHLHGDHFGGLPFFLLHAELVAKRDAPLTIAGPAGIEARVGAALEVLFPGAAKRKTRFPLVFREIEPGRPMPVGGATITGTEVVHPSGSPSLALRVAWGSKIVAYSGDTEWTEALIPVGSGADLLIGECYAFDQPVPYHLNHQTWMENAPRIGARRVVLTHLSAAALDRLDAFAFQTAHDGLEIALA